MRWLLALLLMTFAAMTSAQPVQSEAEALADDAAQYAAQFSVAPDEALRRLKSAGSERLLRPTALLVSSPPASRESRPSIRPILRIAALLTGTDPVSEWKTAGVPVVFRTGSEGYRCAGARAPAQAPDRLPNRSAQRARRRLRPAHRRGRAAGHSGGREPARPRGDPRPRRAGRRRAGAGRDQRAQRVRT